jgi:hypothetical protein
MPIDISGPDEIEVVGESFYREALKQVATAEDGKIARDRIAALVPDPGNTYDRNAVKVTIDEEQVGHLPKEVAAVVAAQVAELTQAHELVTARAEIRGSGMDLGFGIVLHLDLRKLNAAFDDEIEAEFESSVEFESLEPDYGAALIASAEESLAQAGAVPTQSAAGDQAGSQRRQTIERAVEKWKDELIDLTARNRLLYMRDLKSGSLSFDSSARESLLQLVAGKRVALSKLVPRSKLPESPAAKLTPFEDAVRRMRTIVRTARSYEEERGVRTLFLACGVATWRNDRASRPPAAPVLLVPLAIRARGAGQQDFELSLAGELEVNPTLLHMLKVEFNLELDDRELFEHSEMDGVIDTPEELGLAFNWLGEKCAGVPGWAIADRFFLGNFWYAKLPMVKDLERSLDALASHDVAAAFAGDGDARAKLIDQRGVSAAKAAGDVDNLAPGEEFNVLDSDSSQSLAIARARAGENLVLRGPPGTGKSQTIANLICSAIGEGKRVLFVAEKRAAIDAVTKRLNGAGLGDLVLDLHEGAESRKWLAAQLGVSLEAIRATETVVREAEEAQLSRARVVLGDHARELHLAHAPWQISVFGAQLQVLARGRPTVTTRLRGQDLEKVTGSRLAELGEALRDLLALEALSLRAKGSPWADAVIETSDAARGAEQALTNLVALLPKVEEEFTVAARDSGLGEPLAIVHAERLAAAWQAAASCTAVFDPKLFGVDLDQTLETLRPLQGSAVSRLVAAIGSSDYRAARSFVQEHLRSDQALDPRDLFAKLDECRQLQGLWRELRAGESVPAVPGNLATLVSDVQGLRQSAQQLGELAGHDLVSQPFAQLGPEVARLQAESETARILPAIHAARDAFGLVGLGGFLSELEGDQSLLSDATEELERLRWQSLADHLMMLPEADAVAAFRGGRHEQVSGDFREFDRRHVEATAQRVRRLAAEVAVAVQDRFPEQAQLVRDQAKRKRGHMPVRELFSQAPDVVTALRPCWVMSPLMVSQLIPSERAYFDIVVFDEASQVRPVDALTSMIRGEQLVVAGDERQLPPTAFFDATATSADDGADEKANSTEIADYESLLDVLMTLFQTEMLRWHYRSRDERLIGFSNQEIYDGGLTTFPGAVVGDVLKHEFVDGPALEGEARVSPDAEVRRVIELVVEHARDRPSESLGVIALGSPHAEAVEAALLMRIPEHPDLEPFFAEDKEERFFVKNLERVQGDERDAIILAVGYGKLPDGTLPHRFGPLNNAGGERRLNVAVSRAKRRMTVVSSFRADDIDPGRSGAHGVRLLRSFLAYAEEGGELNELAAKVSEPTALHRQIQTALTGAGYECTELLGTSADRIDIAVADPDTHSPAVAIEIDGDAYARRPSVRDRDRLRPEQLERLGWQHISTWSQDWYRDPATAARDLLERVGESLERAKAIKAGEESGVEEAAKEDPDGDLPIGPSPRDRGPRPNFPSGGQAITDWRQQDLVKLATWIESDGLLRTSEELKQELMREVGISRRGSRVVRVLDEVVASLRGSGS